MPHDYAHADMPGAKYDEFDFKSPVDSDCFYQEAVPDKIKLRNRQLIFEVKFLAFAHRHLLQNFVRRGYPE